MIHPQSIIEEVKGATYQVPTYVVTNEGMQDGAGFELKFCKGNKEDESAPRQEGFFTETLIAAAKKYLEDNNVGPLATRETSMAITKLDEALLWIGKRAADRQTRGVQGTYQK
jgi:hypothetical protein